MSSAAFWFVQGPGWALVLYLAVAQCLSAFDYDRGVAMGAQEPAETITEVGVAFFKGYAVADLVYTPLLALGLIGHALGTGWAVPVLAAALGITLYWPIPCLAAVRAAKGAQGWSLPKERQYWMVLPAIAGWGALALLTLLPG